MRVFVEAVGLRGPGLDGWARSRPVLAGADPYVPAPVIVPPNRLLPPNERRRAVETVKLALAVGMEAFEAARRDPAETATVFTSSGGDGATIHDILTVLASPDRSLSPTRFHNSVHNAPAGYWTIASQCREPSSSLCCHDASFAAGLLEAAVQATVDNRVVALLAYDLPYPEPLNSVRPIGAVFGAALLLTPHAGEAALARLDIELQPESGAASVMACPALEDLRAGTPAARSLPLLAALARSARARVLLDYVSGLEIAISLKPAAAALRSAVDRGREPAVASRW